MYNGRIFQLLLTAAASAVLAYACGAAGAHDADSAETSAPTGESVTDSQAGSSVEPGTPEIGSPPVFAPAPKPPIQVPAGTLISMRLDTTLSSHETAVGTPFAAQVIQETSIDGRVVIPVGAVVHGRVTEARAAKKIGSRPILSVSFDELALHSGEPVPIVATLARRGKSELGKDVAIIGGGTIGGAILGDAIHEGEGGTVGAILGGIAGTVGALKTKGKPVVLPAGTLLTIELERSVMLEEVV